MRIASIAVLAASLASTGLAAEYAYPQMPDGSLPDTEVSTNVALHVKADRLRAFSLRILAEDCADMEVLVAVGHDADCDGDLSFEEASFAFGCDCGERYFVDYRAGEVYDGVSNTVCIARRDFDPSWNLAKVVRRGEGSAGEIVTEMVDNMRFSVRIR